MYDTVSDEYDRYDYFLTSMTFMTLMTSLTFMTSMPFMTGMTLFDHYDFS
jgi:hypothetical protein